MTHTLETLAQSCADWLEREYGLEQAIQRLQSDHTEAVGALVVVQDNYRRCAREMRMALHTASDPAALMRDVVTKARDGRVAVKESNDERT